VLTRARRTAAVVAVGALAGLGALPGGALATDNNPQGAGKVALHQSFHFLGFCRGTAFTPPQTAGFAVINATPDTVSATVSLKDGVPGETYLVHLVQVPSFDGCFSGQAQAAMTANDDGNATVRVAVPRDPDTTSAWVALERAGFFAFATEEVPIA